MAATGFTTIGHSDRSLDEFLGMLQAARVALVVDVRAFPRSRSNPAYNIDRLPAALAAAGIGYRHAPALGGRRPRQSGVAESLNAAWRVQSFHNYADYALGPVFGAAFADLLALGSRHRLALMCAEALWWRCHRRIIADHLIFAGHAVEHLMAPGQSEPARPTPTARATEDGRVTYPRPAS
ncbi:DUF488 family protein [uncultured Amaricoccus sp.]|uniref:DUF488 domain-containing protein n=1 Tax=uncultured Amaricoccus sp. TaxID=339341 RepID=UPI00262622B3|nr:DUF488 domain-containing protein [uncultured Amaricoccus sp.]